MFTEKSSLLLLSISIGFALALDICENQMNGAHLAHPADCNKFVECRNGTTDRIRDCPLGLHFNRFMGLCDLRERAACDIEFVSFADEEMNCAACCALYGCYAKPECPTTTITPETTCQPDTSATTGIPTTSTPDTPTPDTHETPGTPASSATPDASITSDTPATPASPATIATPATPATPTTSTTLAGPETPGSPATPVTPVTPTTNKCSSNLTVCQGESDNSAVHVNGTCNQYIICVADCAYIFSCPPGLQYDIVRQQCDYPQNVKCPWQSPPPVTGPSGVTCAHHGQCAGQPDGKLFTDPKSNGYIVCQCECEIERPCPLKTKFDENLLSCQWNESLSNIDNGMESANGTGGKITNSIGKGNQVANNKISVNGSLSGKSTNAINVVCPNNVQICKNQTEGAVFAVDGACNKFFKCTFGCAVENSCPANLVYNPQIEYCDYPQNYKCPWPYAPPSGPSAGPCGIACASGGRCVGQPEGALFPSLTSCSKYVVCRCECEVEMNCARDLYWDRKLLTCNYPTNVTCELV